MCTIMIFLIDLEKNTSIKAMNLYLVPKWTLVFSDQDAKLDT